MSTNGDNKGGAIDWESLTWPEPPDSRLFKPPEPVSAELLDSLFDPERLRLPDDFVGRPISDDDIVAEIAEEEAREIEREIAYSEEFGDAGDEEDGDWDEELREGFLESLDREERHDAQAAARKATKP